MSKEMRYITFVLIIPLLVCSKIGCDYAQIKDHSQVKENRLRLKDINLVNLRKGKADINLVARSLSYDREVQIIEVEDGTISKRIDLFPGDRGVNISFNRGSYDLRDGIINIHSVNGIIFDHNVSMRISDVSLSVETGEISSKSAARIEGNNFEFCGEGFLGDIKDEIYYFTGGVTARIFHL